MQIESLRLKSYRSWRFDDRPVSDIAKFRFKKLETYWKLRAEGCSEEAALHAVETSRSTLFRWQQSYKKEGLPGLNSGSTAPKKRRQPSWSSDDEKLVLKLRRQFPLWGKSTLHAVLKRDHDFKRSESTVGRILEKLLEQGKIKPVCFYYGHLKVKRRRHFNQHAKRFKKGMRANKPGELIQVDHMTVEVWPGRYIKHFEAVCPITKITVSQAYCSATSHVGAEFLKYIEEKMPFAIRSIQVDGGSEFRDAFETLCENKKIPLYVLPPRSPELNGCVERCNRTLRYEFYGLYDGQFEYQELREALAGYMEIYNEYRPHQALKMATPMSYYRKQYLEPKKSHMY